MITQKHYALIAGLIVLGVATSGCASKKYTKNQMAALNQKLSQYEKQTNDRIAFLNNKQQSEMSQVSQRIDATDQKIAAAAAEAAAAAAEAQGTASRSMEEAPKVDATVIAANVESALNLQEVDKADITFGFNKATLTPAARATLDKIAERCQSTPRSVVELAGFTDRTGSKTYNLALSRQRAWAVERYLVAKNVPLRSIHTAGFGEGPAPAGLGPEPESQSGSKRNRQERRVNIRVLGPGETASSTGSDQ